MDNFWDYSVWGFVNLIGVLLLSLLAANLLKKSIKPLRVSLIPTSVLGGIILLVISIAYQTVTGKIMFDTAIFGGNGMSTLEVVTYHCLAFGFIATTFTSTRKEKSRKRTVEIFNTGVTTVSTYLLQGVLGMGITMLIVYFIRPDFFKAAGLLLPFGYGQGTGQALNYGGIYENDFSFVGGKSFGLTVAAMGFLSAAIGGVIHMNVLRKKGKVAVTEHDVTAALNAEQIQSPDEIPMNGSIDKMTIQMAIVLAVYMATYAIIYALSLALPGFRSVLYGFNFLVGVLLATLTKAVLSLLRKKNVAKKEYVNPFLMTRISGFFFDLMIVAGIAAIRLEFLQGYWWILLLLGVVGAFSTYYYNHFVAAKLFPDYAEEQFLVMYGMLTGTASTGIILLREIDTDFKTPAADNLVYQNFPAIVFGFPMMLLATLAPKQPELTFGILVAFFVVMNLILFRAFIFRRKNK